MTVTAIVNPVSGGGRVQRHLPHILAALARRFGPVDVVTTTSTGDGRLKARMAADDGADLVIAIGGDGTISECADGILSSGRPQTALAAIPAGTGSDFVRNLLPARTLDEQIARITFPEVITIDAGCVRRAGAPDIHLLNIASFGLSGAIAASVNARPRPRFVPGKLVFFAHALAGIARHQPLEVGLSIDGGDEQVRRIAVLAIANGPIFGGGMKVAPAARMDDGLFDVVIVDDLPVARLMALFPLIYADRHINHPKVSVVRARSLLARPLGDPARAKIEIDGESAGTLPAGFEIRPVSLTLAMRLKP